MLVVVMMLMIKICERNNSTSTKRQGLTQTGTGIPFLAA